MNEQAKYNLTEGRITGKLLLVALPIIGTQLMQMAYNLTDMFWLGRVSADAVAASGTAGMYTWLSLAFLMIGRMGAEIGVAQSLGGGDEKKAVEYSRLSMWIAILLGLAYGAVLVVFRWPLIGFFNIREAHVVKDAADYLAIIAVAIPFTYISATVAGSFNGSGNSRVPFYINSVGLVANMILDPVLILNLDMGIVGAAIATSLSQALVCVLSVLALYFYKDRPFRRFRLRGVYDREMVRQIFRWSVPVGMESMLFTFLSMLIGRFIAAFGADAMAVQRVGSQIESLSWLIGGGFSSAITAFVGQNYGARKWGRINSGCKVSFLAIGVWGVFVTLLLLFAGRWMFALFLPDPEIVEMGVVYLRILATCQLIGCLEYFSAGIFRGLGKTMPPSIVSAVGNALRVPLTWYLSTTRLGLDGIWWGVTIGAIGRGIWMFVWYLRMASRLPKEDEAAAGQEEADYGYGV